MQSTGKARHHAQPPAHRAGRSGEAALIDAVAAAVGETFRCESVSALLPRVMSGLAGSLGVERLVLLGGPALPVLLQWCAPGAPSPPPWLEAVARLDLLAGARSEEVSAAAPMLRPVHGGDVLLVPVLLEGRLWGRVAVRPSRGAWSRAQIALLAMLGGALGAALTRERVLARSGRFSDPEVAPQKVAQLAHTDALTGLPNRMVFHERLQQAFAAARRGARPFAVLYLDLDRFKEVNDVLGHRSGDRLLQQVGRRLRRATRETDLVARLGGDEFALLQTQLTGSPAAAQLAEKLIEIVSAPYTVDGTELRIGLSVGIAVCADDTSRPELLVTQADQALYRAKLAGRGQYRFYSEEIDQQTRAELALSEQLRTAVARGELELRYQPQIEVATGRVVGMQALLRWRHPRHGLLLPEDFMGVAEKFGHVQQLGRWTLDRACRQLALWRESDLQLPRVAVKVTLGHIRLGRELLRDVTDALARWGLEPADLELDVTEQMLARATLSQSDVLDQLCRVGVPIAIDDFGAQYSSLNYLRGYRVQRLKIARGMIAAAEAEADAGGSAMIRAILSLAAELGVEVVVQGVETAAQRRLLTGASVRAQWRDFYCSYYGRAVPAEEAATLLREGCVALQPRGVHSG